MVLPPRTIVTGGLVETCMLPKAEEAVPATGLGGGGRGGAATDGLGLPVVREDGCGLLVELLGDSGRLVCGRFTREVPVFRWAGRVVVGVVETVEPVSFGVAVPVGWV
jgi:hypothetical protein